MSSSQPRSTTSTPRDALLDERLFGPLGYRTEERTLTEAELARMREAGVAEAVVERCGRSSASR